jgi:hypothetical protein
MLYFACNFVKLCALSQLWSIKATGLFLQSLTFASTGLVSVIAGTA